MPIPAFPPRRNRAASHAAAGISPRPLRLSFGGAFLLLSLIVAVIGTAVYLSALRVVVASVHENLESVARIKVDLVTHWLINARRDADLALDTPMFAGELEDWIAMGQPAGQRRARLVEHLGAAVAVGGFRDVEIRSAQDGRLLLTTNPDSADAANHRAAAMRAVAEQRMVLGDFHATNYGRPGLGIGFDSPIGATATARPVAAMHVELDAAFEFLPFLNRWPGASRTAETLLFRADGDDIVFINHSRHEGGPALSMRRSVDEPGLLAAQAIRGAVGAVVGNDYRGIDALGFVAPVAGTPWYLVAKMDRSEALAALDRTALAAGVVLAALLALFAGWRMERSRRVHASYRAMFERALLTRRLEFLAGHATEGVLLADPAGRIIDANERCAAIYGCRREEIVGKGLEFLWGEAVPLPGPDAVREVAQQRKDGKPIAVEISSRMVDIEGSRYFQALVRDVTERRRAEESLRDSEERARRYALEIDDLYQNAPCGYHSIDAGGIIRRINDTELRWLGYERNEVVGRMHITHLLDGASRAHFTENFAAFVRDGRMENSEFVFVRKDGSLLPVMVSATAIYDPQGNFVASRTTLLDVSRLRMVQQERDRQARRVEAMSRHLIAVQEEERRRLSCELHDRAAPNLAALRLALNTVAHSLPQPLAAELEDCLADADAIVEDTVASVREVCADLRPSLLDYAGLLRALVGYTQQYTRRTGILVRLRLPPGETHLGAELESTLFRIIQEALSNVARHASASSIDIELDSDAAVTSLTIRDDGVGFEAVAQGQGLRAMRERAEFVGASFSCVTGRGAGTAISIRLATPQDAADSPRRLPTSNEIRLAPAMPPTHSKLICLPQEAHEKP